MASRFWVGGSGTWDASDTTHWSATSGGAGGQSVPGSADSVTFNGSSGAGTVTVNANHNILSFDNATHTGTIDFSVNNNSLTATTFKSNGSGVRTLKLGSGTFHITSAVSLAFDFTSATNLTFDAGTSTISIETASSTNRSFGGGGFTFYDVAFADGTLITISGNNTYHSLNPAPGSVLIFGSGSTQTTTAQAAINGTTADPVIIRMSTTAANWNQTSGTPTMAWCLLSGIAFGGGATWTANNSLQTGPLDCSGITINVPSVGAGGNIAARNQLGM